MLQVGTGTKKLPTHFIHFNIVLFLLNSDAGVLNINCVPISKIAEALKNGPTYRLTGINLKVPKVDVSNIQNIQNNR